MNLILLGPIGSGKGTLAEHLSRAHNFASLAMGKALEEYARTDATYRELHNAGEQAPTSVVMDILARTLASPPLLPDGRQGTGWLLDGVVRNPEQAHYLCAALASGRMPPPDAILVLRITPEQSEARIRSRATCSNSACARIYNLLSSIPLLEGTCDACGSALTQRAMDTSAESRATRMRIDLERALPAIEILRQQSGIPLHEIDASGTPEQVAAEADRTIESIRWS